MRNLNIFECTQVTGAKQRGTRSEEGLSEEILAELMLVGTGFGLTLGLKVAGLVGTGVTQFIACTMVGTVLGAAFFPAAAYRMFNIIKPYYLD